MSSNTEARTEPQACDFLSMEWIRTPGWHTVRIAHWRFDPPGKRRFVIFELRDDGGRLQTVRFSLFHSMRNLHDSKLLRFVVAALNVPFVEWQGQAFAVDNAKTFKDLVSRRVAICVAKNNRGFHDVVNWAAAPQAKGEHSPGNNCI